MKIWVDDVRPAPSGYVWLRTTSDAIRFISRQELTYQQLINAVPAVEHFTLPKVENERIELIDLDHDAGDYASYGGDYIKILDWLEQTGRSYPIHIHSMNPVGVQNMRTIIQKNGWKEV